MSPRPPPPSSFQVPTSGTDTLATFYQILSVQSLHYLTLCILIPPLLAIFSYSPQSLNFEGGPAQIGMILDWRELSSRRTFDWTPLESDDFLSWRKGYSKEVLLAGLDEADQRAAKLWKAGSVWLGDVEDDSHNHTVVEPVVLDATRIIRPNVPFAGGSKGIGSAGSNAGDGDDIMQQSQTSASKAENDLEQWEWSITRDPSRGWAIAIAWAAACAVDVFLLTTVVRRPKHILDHVATLHLIHLLLTAWYTSSIPTALFWWIVVISHGVACIVGAERWAIRREMSVSVGHGLVGRGDEERGDVQEEAIPLRERSYRYEDDDDGNGNGNGAALTPRSAPHVLFDGEDEEDDEDADVAGKSPSAPPTMQQSRSGLNGSSGSSAGLGSGNHKSPTFVKQ